MVSCDAQSIESQWPAKQRESSLCCAKAREGGLAPRQTGMEAGTGYSAFSSNLTAALTSFGFLAGWSTHSLPWRGELEKQPCLHICHSHHKLPAIWGSIPLTLHPKLTLHMVTSNQEVHSWKNKACLYLSVYPCLRRDLKLHSELCLYWLSPSNCDLNA